MYKESSREKELHDKLPEDINNLSDISIDDLSENAVQQFRHGIERLMLEVNNLDEKDIDEEDDIKELVSNFDMEKIYQDPRIKDIFGKPRRKEKKIMNNIVKGLIIAACIFIIFAFLPIHINETISAFKFKLFDSIIEFKNDIFKLKSTDEDVPDEEIIEDEPVILNFITLEEAKNNIDVKFLYSDYIPEGYEIKYIEYERISNVRYSIRIAYTNKNDENIYFEQNHRLSAEYVFSQNEMKTIIYNNLELYLSEGNDKYNVTWFEKNVEFYLSGIETEDMILKFIDNLSY